MTRPTLKPCPFCGSEPRWHYIDPEPGNPNAGARYVQCGNAACGVSTRLYFPVMQEVFSLIGEAWNRRSTPSQDSPQ
jgi:Lar family restriction alleviation protein